MLRVRAALVADHALGQIPACLLGGKLLVERTRSGGGRDLYLGDGRERRTQGWPASWFPLRRLAPRHGLVTQLASIAAEHPGEDFAVAVAEHFGQAAFKELMQIGAVAPHHDRGVGHGQVALTQQVPDSFSYRVVRRFAYVCRHMLGIPNTLRLSRTRHGPMAFNSRPLAAEWPPPQEVVLLHLGLILRRCRRARAGYTIIDKRTMTRRSARRSCRTFETDDRPRP